MDFAPRISPRLRARIEQLADTSSSAAEITRAVGELAGRLGLPRPSYEQVRKLAREHQARPRPPSTGEVLLDVALRIRPPDAIVSHLAGTEPPVRRK